MASLRHTNFEHAKHERSSALCTPAVPLLGKQQEKNLLLLDPYKLPSIGGERFSKAASRNNHKQIMDWPQLYDQRCKKAQDIRKAAEERAKRKRLLAISKAREVKQNFVTQTHIVEAKTVVNPEPWKEFWGRNFKCEQCSGIVVLGNDRLVCYLCPAVRHRSLCIPLPENLNALTHQQPSTETSIWICEECKDTLTDEIKGRREESLRAGILALERHKAAVLIQQTVRRFLSINLFRRCLYSLNKTQALVRGALARFMFRRRYSKRFRSIHVKVLSTNFYLDPEARIGNSAKAEPPQVRVIVTLVNNETSNLPKYGRREFDDETQAASDASILANSTRATNGWAGATTVSWQDEGGGGIVHVPSTHSMVQAVFTVVTLAPTPSPTRSKLLKAVKAEHGANFVGQVSVDLQDCILYSQPIRDQVLRLGSCQVPVELKKAKDTRDTKVNGLWGAPALGDLKFEVIPCSHVTSQCGFVVDVSSALSNNQPLKKRFLVVEGGTLRFFARPMDRTPRILRVLHNATAKWHKKTGVVEVRSEGEWFHYFTGADYKDGKKWYTKIHAAIAVSGGTYRAVQLAVPFLPDETGAQNETK
jgi:hypothetical protein